VGDDGGGRCRGQHGKCPVICPNCGCTLAANISIRVVQQKEQNLQQRRLARLTPDHNIDELELGVSATRELKAAGVTTIGDLCAMTRSQVLRIRRIGAGSIAIIEQRLLMCGLSLADHASGVAEGGIVERQGG
jgi:DNA-directed RNA polymerase alpha subunit